MTLVQGCNRSCKKHPSVTLADFFSPPKLGVKLFNQPTRLLEANFPIVVVLTTVFSVSKYTEKDLQQIFKTILEARASTTSEKS